MVLNSQCIFFFVGSDFWGHLLQTTEWILSVSAIHWFSYTSTSHNLELECICKRLLIWNEISNISCNIFGHQQR